MSFGTGAVKITPAHDPNDFKAGQRHKLEFITIFTQDGAIAEAGGSEFAGMMRFDARVDVMKALKEKGLYRGEADNEMGMHNRPVAFSFILLAHFGLLPAVASLIISV